MSARWDGRVSSTTVVFDVALFTFAIFFSHEASGHLNGSIIIIKVVVSSLTIIVAPKTIFFE
jgi:hypothetical protein